MNEWKPTHRTKPDVEVMVHPEGACWRVTADPMDTLSGPLLGDRQLATLFEPIPKPATVEVGLCALRNLLRCFDDLDRADKPIGFNELQRAAEQAAVVTP